MDFDIFQPNDCLIRTRGNGQLIEALYLQDIDLGVGKEVFDPIYREELERERHLEFIKQQEKEKQILQAREKLEQEKRKQKEDWLKHNFRRDGETGEWVQRWNNTDEGSRWSLPAPAATGEEEFITLEEALEFLGKLGSGEENIDPADLTEEPHRDPLFMRQDSFNENWNSLVDYLNMTATGNEVSDSLPTASPAVPSMFGVASSTASPAIPSIFDVASSTECPAVPSMFGVATSTTRAAVPSMFGVASSSTSPAVPSMFGEASSTTRAAVSPLFEVESFSSLPGLDQNISIQRTDGLIRNVSVPTSCNNTQTAFNVLSPVEELNASLSYESANMDTTVDDIDLGDLTIFNNLSSLPNLTAAEVDSSAQNTFFNQLPHAPSTLLTSLVSAEDMDAIKKTDDNLSISHGSIGGASPYSSFDEELEGSTAGSEDGQRELFSKMSHLSDSSRDSGYAFQGGFSSPSSSYTDSPRSKHNFSGSSDTEYDPHDSFSVAHQLVMHNHTFQTLPGHVPREVKKYTPQLSPRKGPQSRDHRRAEELMIPFSVEDIINSSVERFNEMLALYKLTDTQLMLVRDIRRRGKNKVAAQNCRKRKVTAISSLAEEKTELHQARDRLLLERATMDLERQRLQDKFSHLYVHIFQSLRNEHGRPYDPSLFSLQQSSDGSVFLVPRSTAFSHGTHLTNGCSVGLSSYPVPAGTAQESGGSRKRKNFDEPN